MNIPNAKDIPLDANSGTLPQMTDALTNWFQQMVFQVIAKTVVNYKVVETSTDVCFQGVWVPIAQKLVQSQIGQRKWKWYSVFSDPSLLLDPDDKIVFQGSPYRVMSVEDFSLYGYRKYDLVQDYE
jgi:hypothetical protein